jgi:3-oxoacyl-[acyl-carrier protein] reductase
MNKKVALIVGSNGGIGLETVNLMLDKGINVCCAYNKNTGNLEKLMCEDKPGSLSLHKADISDNSSVESMLKGVYENHSRIDIVVFSVALPTRNKQVLKMEWIDFKERIELQTRGLFNIIQSMKDQIKEKHKTKFIVILTEYCIGKPPSGLADYVTAKYSLMGFAKAMAVELSKYNCTVNMISPGMVKSDLTSGLPPKLIEITVENNPLKRIAVPKDVANVVMFLSSDKSDYLRTAV